LLLCLRTEGVSLLLLTRLTCNLLTCNLPYLRCPASLRRPRQRVQQRAGPSL